MSVVAEVLEVHKFHQRGPERIEVLRGVDLSVRAGEFLALMGPSGSGKTTLLNLMAGIDTPSSGRVIIQGQDISRFNEDQLAAWRTRSIGYIFQAYNLVPVLTAYENVELPLLLLRLPRKRRHEQVMHALEAVGLADRSRHLPSQLSGGQEQRVAIARALAPDPPLLLGDEPTGNLDRESADAMLDLIRLLCRELGKTFVMATHDPRAAEAADRVARVEKGVLREEGARS